MTISQVKRYILMMYGYVTREEILHGTAMKEWSDIKMQENINTIKIMVSYPTPIYMEEDYTKKFYAKRLSDMFTQPCFIRKNTKEIIEKLEELGYDYAENGAGAWFIPLCQLEYIGVNLYSKGYYMGVNGVWSNDWYDCGTNEQLFLALAALRDDTDENQWFVYPKENYWFKCYDNNIDEARNEPSTRMSCQAAWFYESRKATPQELIEYFKEK